ncbi:MAG: hypothetical protein GY858_09305 [Candidatus Omnitrophica bacterium]|nr:hypothetical protein [Candidatus Omnitrophota bacterium]
MTIETMRAVFGWCSVINMGLLLWWFFAIVVLHDFVYRVHTKWFKLSVESFDKIHYAGIAFFKIVVFVFNIVPYFALRIVE